jgi:queuine tRNA-ribosyltransferase
MAELAAAELPEDRPRYLMGVGHPIDIVDAVMRGVDLFDCVLPTRAGRHGQAYTSQGRRNLRNARYADDPAPLDPACGCPVCQGGLSRAYLRHLVHVGEAYGKRLLTQHNLSVYQRLVADLREAVVRGDEALLSQLREQAALITARAA